MNTVRSGLDAYTAFLSKISQCGTDISREYILLTLLRISSGDYVVSIW